MIFLQPFPITFNKNKEYENQFQQILIICIFLILFFLAIWYIFYSEPFKIYRIEKIQPIQFLL